MLIFLACLVGLFSGVASGLFGVGGGIIMVPAMVILMKIPMKIAVGTSLSVIIPTAMVGTWKHWGNEGVDWRVALALAPFTMLGGYWGAVLVQGLPAASLKRYFGGFLILMGLYMVARK